MAQNSTDNDYNAAEMPGLKNASDNLHFKEAQFQLTLLHCWKGKGQGERNNSTAQSFDRKRAGREKCQPERAVIFVFNLRESRAKNVRPEYKLFVHLPHGLGALRD